MHCYLFLSRCDRSRDIFREIRWKFFSALTERIAMDCEADERNEPSKQTFPWDVCFALHLHANRRLILDKMFQSNFRQCCLTVMRIMGMPGVDPWMHSVGWTMSRALITQFSIIQWFVMYRQVSFHLTSPQYSFPSLEIFSRSIWTEQWLSVIITFNTPWGSSVRSVLDCLIWFSWKWFNHSTNSKINSPYALWNSVLIAAGSGWLHHDCLASPPSCSFSVQIVPWSAIAQVGRSHLTSERVEIHYVPCDQARSSDANVQMADFHLLTGSVWSTCLIEIKQLKHIGHVLHMQQSSTMNKTWFRGPISHSRPWKRWLHRIHEDQSWKCRFGIT
jgi:hypothetical protein